MTPAEIEAMLEHLQARTLRIEQILPTLATKEDLRAFEHHFSDALGGLGARLDGRIDSLEASLNARIDAVEARLGARIDAVEAGLNARIDGLSRQMLVLHEDLKSDVRLLAEHLARVLERLDERR